MPTLFNPNKIDDVAPQFSEPLFIRLNRLSDPHLAKCRADLEDWLTRYPLHGQIDLIKRFRSRDDRAHLSAFFELYLHELLLQQGYTVEIHPGITGTSKSPDFGVADAAGNRFYLEAVLATDESDEDYQGRSIANGVYDYINANLSNADFFLGLTLYGVPKSQPSLKPIVAFLREKLITTSYDELAAIDIATERDKVPVWKYQHESWIIEFRPLPKKVDRRVATGRVIGVWMNGFSKDGSIKSIHPEEAIRRALKTKATRYGQLDRPYIVAINALSLFTDRRDAQWALFGDDKLLVTPALVPSERNTFEWMREANGSWHNPYGSSFSRVSGVMIVGGVQPHAHNDRDIVIYENPAASCPLVTILPRLVHAKVEGDCLIYTDQE